MKENGLTPMVTLWHYAMPQWFAKKGGFANSQAADIFASYARFVAQNLGDEFNLYCTVNEPEMWTNMAYGYGKYPPFEKSYVLYVRVLNNLIRAHKKAYAAIKQVRPNAMIGIAKNYNYYEPYRPYNLIDRILVLFSNEIANHYFLQKISKYMDFVGLNYYFFDLLKFKFPLKKLDMNYNFAMNRPTDPKYVQRSDMGWRTFPEGIYHALKDLARYKKPIYITENGIANARDDMRKDFIRQHLQWTAKAIAEGVDVRGYFYWSLIDNYEWADGYGPLFGLVEINRSTLERRVRPSAEVIKEIEIQS
jgi:beta-glucosidase